MTEKKHEYRIRNQDLEILRQMENNELYTISEEIKSDKKMIKEIIKLEGNIGGYRR